MAKKKHVGVFDRIDEEGFFQGIEMKGDQMYIEGKPVPKDPKKEEAIKKAMGVKKEK